MSQGRILIVLCCLIGSFRMFSQENPLAQGVRERTALYPAYTSQFFKAERGSHPDLSEHVREALFYRLNTNAVREVVTLRPELLTLPIETDKESVTLELFRTEIFGDAYHLETSTGPARSGRDDMVFYRGIIHGDPNSLAVVSILGDDVHVLYSSNTGGNHRLHKTQDGHYILYNERDVHQTGFYRCDVSDEQLIGSGVQDVHRSMTGNCVQIYFECDKKCYTDNGSSVPNTEAWVASLFNEVATIYENEEIPVFISEIYVWTTTDPYAGLNSTGAMLNEFVTQTNQNSWDGRLAHLLSTRGLGGGIAYINVLCSNTYNCGVSTSLSTNIVGFPTYSWTIECVTHELGHNFGSQHTHACVWNGNQTQIDDCGSVYGDTQPCYDPNNPILPDDGTIMSYCHLIGGVGINFSLGFGPQPGDLIRSKYENASCNTGTCTPPNCTDMAMPEPGSTLIDVNTNISWYTVVGVDGYRLTIGTSPGSGNIVNNLDVGNDTIYDPSSALPYNSTIYVKVVPYNVIGNATGCSNNSFTTEANVAPSCTNLISPEDGAVDVDPDADLLWLPSVGHELGYKLTVGTTSGGGEILNLFDVGNVTTYSPASLPSNTTIYVRITPYWSGGDIQNCPVESFMTGAPAYCASYGSNWSFEWISSVSLGTFNNSSGAHGYTDFTDDIIDVSIGGSYPVSLTPGFNGGPYNEYFRVWIDQNHDGIFDNPGERVFQSGPVTGTTNGSITIPLTTLTGPTRMRVAMRYNSYSTPCQLFAYGEVEDYSLNVHCNLVTNTASQGTGSLRWAIGCVSPGETISFTPSLEGDTITLSTTTVVINTPLTIMSDMSDNIWIYGVTAPRAFEISASVTATIHGLRIIGGTNADGSAIRNYGDLTLHSVELFKHPGILDSKPLENPGTLTFQGANTIH